MLLRPVMFSLTVLATALAPLSVPDAQPVDKPPDTVSIKKLTDPLIREHRMGTLTIKTKPGMRVTVTQLRHDFPFGTAVATRMLSAEVSSLDRERYFTVLANNFNTVSPEDIMKWRHNEGTMPGLIDYRHMDTLVEWCEENDIQVRGHCLFFAVDTTVAEWQRGLANDKLRTALARRARGATSRYRGSIFEYDLNNEMVHGDFYRKRLGDGIVADMARWAHEGDPGAALYLNDYYILDGRDTAAYLSQIRDFLAQGVPLGGIGCQSHFRTSIPLDTVRSVLDSLAQFNLPVKITEFDMEPPDDETLARELDSFYRTCFAHPAVAGIVMWGFWEGAHWRPASAPWKLDWTPGPAAQTYRNLVFREWWTTWEGTANDDGYCVLQAFYGRYRVAAGDVQVIVEMSAEDGSTSVLVEETAK